MIRNYLITIFRNIRNHLMFSMINVTGLAIGIACCIIVLLFIKFEFSFDTFNQKANLIYRVNTVLNEGAEPIEIAETMAPLGPALLNEIPEVEEAVRLKRKGSCLFSAGQNHFYERFFFADNSIFNVFTFPLLRGDAATALSEPNTAVITEKIAEKYFGEADPIGRFLTVQKEYDVLITGIIKEFPQNSHFRTSILISFSSLNTQIPALLEEWDSFEMFYTYILLSEGAEASDLKDKLSVFMEKYTDDDNIAQLSLQPVTEIHLSPKVYEISSHSSKAYSYMFMSIAVFILIIACINFMNLSTARSAFRAREVGMRKVLGAYKSQLIRQFLSESLLMAFMSLIIALALVEVFLPLFNDLAELNLSLSYFENVPILAILIAITFTAGIIAGSYPALYMSSFKPSHIMKGAKYGKPGSGGIRKGLVVLQFAISIVLIIGTGIISKQIDFMKSKDLGFDKEQIVVMALRGAIKPHQVELFKNELLGHSEIDIATGSGGAPGSNQHDVMSFTGEGMFEGETVGLQILTVDYDYFKAYNHEIIEGREFSPEITTDKTEAFVINETVMRRFGWESAIGKRLQMGADRSGIVIGVVKDFHYFSVRRKIDPIVFMINDASINYVSAIIKDNIPSAVSAIRETWNELTPDFPFEYFFVDDSFERQYKREERMMKVFGYCAMLAIFIACLGLFGLASFMAEQRSKEIGIRKALGASSSGIAFLLSREFTRLVLVSNLIAWPVAFLLMDSWLMDFPYRTVIGLGSFLLAALIALIIALLTVSSQALKAAAANPTDSLRNE